jgi:hypothetical protein
MRFLFGSLPRRAILTVTAGCVAIGWFFGLNAGGGYQLLHYVLFEPLDGPRGFALPHLGSLGGVLGAAGGLAVSLIWCRRMSRLCKRGGTTRIAPRGGMLGAGLGVLCTSWLHAGLIVAMALDSDRPYKPLLNPMIICIGLACGVISGAILGSLGSFLCRHGEAREQVDSEPPVKSAQLEAEAEPR